MLAGSYLVSVIPLYSYQFLFLRVSSNYPFYLLVLLVSSRCTTCGPSGLLPLVSRGSTKFHNHVLCSHSCSSVSLHWTQHSQHSVDWSVPAVCVLFCSFIYLLFCHSTPLI